MNELESSHLFFENWTLIGFPDNKIEEPVRSGVIYYYLYK